MVIVERARKNLKKIMQELLQLQRNFTLAEVQSAVERRRLVDE